MGHSRLFEAESFAKILYSLLHSGFRDQLDRLYLTHIGKYMSLGVGVINPGLIYFASDKDNKETPRGGRDLNMLV